MMRVCGVTTPTFYQVASPCARPRRHVADRRWSVMIVISVLVVLLWADIGRGESDDGLYNYLFEGDIMMDVGARNAVPRDSQLWPGASIPFSVNPSVGCPVSAQCRLLMAAMAEYHDKTCVRFKEWTGEPHRVVVHYNSDDGACWSMVGRSSHSAQQLSLGNRCWYLGIVIHELGHCVGFWHEMTRRDRDQFIKIFWDNVQTESISQFKIRENGNTLNETFDFDSVMLYDEFAFSKTKKDPTMAPLIPGKVIGPIWNKTRLSVTDIRKIAKLYKCEGTDPKPTFPPDVHCDFNTHTCGFTNGGRPAWKHRRFNQTSGAGGYVHVTHATAGPKGPQHFVSVNFHGVGAGHLPHSKGCLRFRYQLRGKGSSNLKLYQIRLQRATDITYGKQNAKKRWMSSRKTVGAKWRPVALYLDVRQPFKLIFDALFHVRARSGDVALDDVEVLYSPCSLDIPRPTTKTISTSTHSSAPFVLHRSIV